MSDAKLPFSRPSIGEEEIAEVVAVLRSGWITSGPRVKRFEADFAERLGVQHAVAVSSCTAGLQLALDAHGVGPGDEVVVPSMTWPTTANVVEQVGARPVFADVDRGTLQVTPESLEAAISPKTRALIPVHFAGQACDLTGIEELARARGLLVIHDAAHAIGTEHLGVPIGGNGHTAVFSFHPIKNITTAEGGMITTNDDALLEPLRLRRFHGVNRDAWARYGEVDSPRYEAVLPGYKYNLSDLHAALGIHQLAKLDRFIDARTRLAEAYLQGLADADFLRLPEQTPWTTRHAWHLFVVAIDPEAFGIGRDEVMARLSAKGVGTGLHFTAVHLHRYYRERYGHREGDLPESEWASERVLSLPLFPDMSEDDVARVCSALHDVAREARR
jgi:UDP-4-amino-4-deoxy-L-arabinose-oxoglutarate aminotransferase